jgi:putative peptidoglycan lipid II flippase
MKIFKHAKTVSIFTGLSRVLGLLREILMAAFFGTSLAKSAFDVAFRMPNLFRRLFGEGALSAAFIPILSETIEKEGKEAARLLAGKVMTLLATLLTMITIGTLLVITITINHADLGQKAAAVLPLLRIMFPYMIFICLVALCMGIMNTSFHFALPAATPIILNLVWIASLFLLCPKFGTTLSEQIYGVAWGILIAGIIQLAVQLPALIHIGMLPRLSFKWNDPHIKHILLLIAPVIVGTGIHQINVVVDGVLALWVSSWAPAALTYAERLVYLPLGIFTTALSTVLLPTFSQQAARSEISNIRETIAKSTRGLMLVMIPATAGLMVFTKPIVQLVFERGVFDSASTRVTALALLFYAPGLIVFSLSKILTPAFYALKDTRAPVKIGIYTLALNFVLNITFILTWPDGYQHAGLAFATVIASAVNCTALAVIITKRIGSPGWISLGISFLKITASATLMAITVLMIHRFLESHTVHFTTAAKKGQLLNVSASISAGIAVYAIAALTICRTECRSLRRR